MRKDYSGAFQGTQQVRGKQFKLSNAGFLAKKVGVLIFCITFAGFCGSMFMGWMIQTGLNDLAHKEQMKQEIIKERQHLIIEKQQLLAKNNIESAASELGLYPGKPEQVVRRF